MLYKETLWIEETTFIHVLTKNFYAHTTHCSFFRDMLRYHPTTLSFGCRAIFEIHLIKFMASYKDFARQLYDTCSGDNDTLSTLYNPDEADITGDILVFLYMKLYVLNTKSHIWDLKGIRGDIMWVEKWKLCKIYSFVTLCNLDNFLQLP